MVAFAKSKRTRRAPGEVKASIYRALDKHGRLGFVRLSESSRTNRVSLSKYIKHGLEAREIERDPITQEYYLTDDGRDELDAHVHHKSINQYHAKRIIQHPIRLSNSFLTLEPNVLKTDIDLDHALMNAPLPMPIDVITHGSSMLDSVFDRAEQTTRFLSPGLTSMQAPEEVLKGLIGSFARDLLWGIIMARIWNVLKEHHALSGDGPWNRAVRAESRYNATENPPPLLKLENILGFDLDLTIRYDGKKLMSSRENQAVLERTHIADRLAGSILLDIAGRIGCDPEFNTERMIDKMFPLGVPSYYDLVPLLESGGLLSAQDIEKIRQGRILEVAYEHMIKGQVIGSDVLPGWTAKAAGQYMGGVLRKLREQGMRPKPWPRSFELDYP